MQYVISVARIMYGDNCTIVIIMIILLDDNSFYAVNDNLELQLSHNYP